MGALGLTSAECGFAYAWRACGDAAGGRYEVEELSAAPLRSFLGDDDGSAPLEEGATLSWWRRGAPGLSEEGRAYLEPMMALVEQEGPLSEVEAYQLERTVGHYLAGIGGDLSPMHGEGFDLRRWLVEGGRLPLAGKLVILGASLVGAVEVVSMRRRLAAVVQGLPPPVQRYIRHGLEAIHPLDEAVVRRVYEVYSRLVREKSAPDEELATLGLFFLISGASFRQSAAMDLLKGALPKRLARRVDPFCRACVQSGKPELSLLIAPVVAALGRVLQEPWTA